VQTGKVRPMPIVLVGHDFWTRVVNWEALVEEGMISVEDKHLYTIVETAEEAARVIYEFYNREAPEVE
jgi:hypothetical protein